MKRPKAVLCASTGGHLTQLVRITSRADLADDSLWITFDSPQSQSMLAGRRTLFVPYVAPRDFRGAIKAAAAIRREVQGEKFDFGLSTGAAVAVSAFSVLALKGVPLTYIESVSRTDGPSVTGRLMALSGRVNLRTQHQRWEDKRWRYVSSVLDAFTTEQRDVVSEPRDIFVTLGTIKPYRFDSAVDALKRTGCVSDRTTWQLGVTTRDDLPGQVRELIPTGEFEDLVMRSDVVVTHSGVGTIIQLLEKGVRPVVLVRRSARGEHVDDHQEQIARLLADRGLAVVCEVGELTAEHLKQAASTRVVPIADNAQTDELARTAFRRLIGVAGNP